MTDLPDRRNTLQKRNATVAVIGAGDYIGGEIARSLPQKDSYSPVAATAPSSNRW
jgi:hypothetical protein